MYQQKARKLPKSEVFRFISFYFLWISAQHKLQIEVQKDSIKTKK